MIDAQCELLEPASLKSTSLDLDEKCCNVDAGAESAESDLGSAGAHRRTQGAGCVLGTCTTECAETFVPLFENCPQQMQTLLNGVPGVYRFLGKCYMSQGCPHEGSGGAAPASPLPPSECPVHGGNASPGASCVFPFSYGANVYDACTALGNSAGE